MEIYHYHPETGEHLGTGQAREDPEETGKHLIPANATTTVPPDTISGQVRVLKDGAWTHELDHRGETWYRPNGDSIIIKDLGNPADDGLLSTAPVQIIPVKAVKLEASRRISLIAEDWKQRNIMARSIELLNKIRLGGTLTTEEEAEEAAALAIWAQIKAVRAASDAIEAMNPIPADYATNETYWTG